jgi:aminopeptidase
MPDDPATSPHQPGAHAPRLATPLTTHHSPLTILAEVLVRYSTALRPGEVVSLLGPSPAEPLLVALYREALAAGAQPIVLMTPPACEDILLRHGSAAQLGFLSPLEVRELEVVDVAIHVLATAERRQPATDPARLALRHQSRRPLLDLFMRRTTGHGLRWTATHFPGLPAARDAGLSLSEYERLLFHASLLDRDDPVAAWQEQGRRQQRLVDFLRGVRELRFVTPAGTDLRVGVAGRAWINGAGQENFPDGEVFTAPLEHATEGTVCFDWPALHGDQVVEGVRLVFRAGRVVEASARRGQEYLLGLLDQDPGARVLGEVAFGCNYALDRPTRNPLLDEKVGGTFHLALGAAYPKSGGLNRSGLHWDLVCDLRQGGRIEADGQVISENGRFRNASWPQPEA